jgi:hypothetical protein
MVMEKKPRLFSGKWFSRLSKEEAIKANSEMDKSQKDIAAARDLLKRYSELEEKN